jgi:hypothetical protein
MLATTRPGLQMANDLAAADFEAYFDNLHIQKLRSAAITASGALIQSGIV